MPANVTTVIDAQVSEDNSTWSSFISDSSTLTFTRGNEQTATTDKPTLGTLATTTLGAAWNPAINTTLRPGRFVRVRGKTDTGTWRTIWYGRLNVPQATYNRDGNVYTSLTATDVINRLDGLDPAVTNYRDALFHRQLKDAISQKTGAYPIGANIEGDNSDASPPTVLSPADGTGLARLGVVLDSWPRASAWAARDSETINGIDGYTAPAGWERPVPFKFADRYDFVDDSVGDIVSDAVLNTDPVYSYTDIELAHDAETFTTVITSTQVPGLSVPGTEKIRDVNGATQWGRREAEMPAVIRQSVGLSALRHQPEPAFRVRTISIDMSKHRALLDQDPLYSRNIRVVHTPSGHNEVYRVIHEAHTIEPDTVNGYRWKATYTLKAATQPRDITIVQE